jgi:uncharacterized protein (TIGR03437 family)
MKFCTNRSLTTLSTGCTGKFIVPGLFFACILNAQISSLSNASVSGPFFFRHLEFTTDTSGNITDCRSALGTMTFNGAGQYTLNAQQTVNTFAATPLTGTGAYSIGPSGVMSIGNPQRNTLSINARLGTEAIVGSTTESGDNTFDLFIAIPAATPAQAAANFLGNFNAATLEFPLGTAMYVRSAYFNLSPVTGGFFSAINGTGHALNVNTGQLTAFNLTGAIYTLNGDGTASANLGSANNFLTGYKTILISASGNIILGGSSIAGSHDFLIGVRPYSGAAALANWSGLFYKAGLRYDARYPTTAGYVGSANAIPSASAASTYQREHQIAATPSAFDDTGYQTVSLNADGTFSDGPLNRLAFDANGQAFIEADLDNVADSEGFSIDFGIAADSLSGTGVYINPNGIFNAASFSPPGGPISPGEFITIFGSGLASSQAVASPPYPTSLGGVSVTVNSLSAPIYLASPNQLNVLVPYGVTGTTATIAVNNKGQASDSVVVPLAATAPGVFTQNSDGTGAGVIVHSNNSLVTSTNPAKKGETVTIYLSGLGAVSPPVADGAAGPVSPLSNTVETVSVTIGNVSAVVSYAGLAPGFPGLYQINATVPSNLVGSGDIGLAIQTAEAFAEQATIAIR